MLPFKSFVISSRHQELTFASKTYQVSWTRTPRTGRSFAYWTKTDGLSGHSERSLVKVYGHKIETGCWRWFWPYRPSSLWLKDRPVYVLRAIYFLNHKSSTFTRRSLSKTLQFNTPSTFIDRTLEVKNWTSEQNTHLISKKWYSKSSKVILGGFMVFFGLFQIFKKVKFNRNRSSRPPIAVKAWKWPYMTLSWPQQDILKTCPNLYQAVRTCFWCRNYKIDKIIEIIKQSGPLYLGWIPSDFYTALKMTILRNSGES